MVEVPKAQDSQQQPFNPPTPPQTPVVCEKFMGMNTSPTRPGVSDDQVFWLDGFMPLDDMNCLTLPDVGPTFYSTSSPTIVYFDFFNIGAVPYIAVFLSDGSALAINTGTGAGVVMAPAATFVSPSITLLGSCQYGSQYFLIVNQQANGYFIWDGVMLYVPGGPAPGGGTMPTALHGNAIEVYQQRIWIANDASIFFSAPGSLIDFTSASGGGNFTSADSFLRVRFVRLLSVNGFLYLVADSSCNYISGVQTSGSPPVTTFTNQNIDAQVGSPYPASVEVFGRNVLMANSFGVQVIYGSEIKKVSKPLDGVYATVSGFGGQQLSSGQATIYGRRVWAVLVPIVDPVLGTTRNKFLLWDGDKKWWAAEQTFLQNPIMIRHQEINSTFILWATDGFNIKQVFVAQSNLLTKTIWTKQWHRPGGFASEKTADMFWGAFRIEGSLDTITVKVDNEDELAGAVTVNIPSPTVLGNYVPGPISVVQPGQMIGMLCQTKGSLTTVMSLALNLNISQYRG